MEKAKRFTLNEMHELDIKLGLEKTEIYGLWEDGKLLPDDAVKQLSALQAKIHDILQNPGYTLSDDYYDIVWARMYEGAEGTYTIEMGYVYRRRLEILMDTIDIDVVQIGLDSDLDITVY